MSSQILIMTLVFYFREPATEHVNILAPGYPRKTYRTAQNFDGGNIDEFYEFLAIR